MTTLLPEKKSTMKALTSYIADNSEALTFSGIKRQEILSFLLNEDDRRKPTYVGNVIDCATVNNSKRVSLKFFANTKDHLIDIGEGVLKLYDENNPSHKEAYITFVVPPKKVYDSNFTLETLEEELKALSSIPDIKIEPFSPQSQRARRALVVNCGSHKAKTSTPISPLALYKGTSLGPIRTIKKEFGDIDIIFLTVSYGVFMEEGSLLMPYDLSLSRLNDSLFKQAVSEPRIKDALIAISFAYDRVYMVCNARYKQAIDLTPMNKNSLLFLDDHYTKDEIYHLSKGSASILAKNMALLNILREEKSSNAQSLQI